MSQDKPTPGDEARIREILETLRRTELTGGESPHALQHAGTPQSGYSVGVTQRDFAQMRPEDLKDFEQVLQYASHLGETTGETIRKALARPGKSSVVESHRKAIDAALATAAGRSWIAGVDRRRAERVEELMQEVIAAARPESRPWLTSPTGRRALADNINQFGEPNSLKEFVAGRVARFNGKDHELDGNLTTEKYVDYVRGYTHFQKHPKDMARRLGEVSKLAGDPALDAAARTAARVNVLQGATPPRKPAMPPPQPVAPPSPTPNRTEAPPEKRTQAKPATGLDRLQALFGRPFEHLVQTSRGRVPVDDPAVLHVDEIDALMAAPAYRQSLHPQAEKTRATVGRWFEATYPGPAQYDATGRMIRAPRRERPAAAPSWIRDQGALSLEGAERSALTGAPIPSRRRRKPRFGI